MLDQAGSKTARRQIIQQLSDGLCFSCDKLATKLVSYQIGDREQKATKL